MNLNIAGLTRQDNLELTSKFSISDIFKTMTDAGLQELKKQIGLDQYVEKLKQEKKKEIETELFSKWMPLIIIIIVLIIAFLNKGKIFK